MPAAQTSLWLDGARRDHLDEFRAPLEAGVAIIGGGIVGATAAHLLTRRGHRVVLLEALRIGEQITGGSSAKVTSQHTLIYSRLSATFDEALARTYGEANQWAVDAIENTAAELGIDCSFERRPAYTYSIERGRVDELHAEAQLAGRLGLPARFVTEAPLPFKTVGAVVFDDQAQFDPYAYIAGLVRAVRRDGGRVIEGVRVNGVDDSGDRVTLQTDRGTVVARDVIIATSLPFIDDGKYFSRTLPKAHAVLTAKVPSEPVRGMFIGIDNPTRSLRSVRRADGDWLLLVGPSFAPGDADMTEELAQLEAFAREHFPIEAIGHGWWNEDYYSIDALPYVGRLERDREHLFVATGFSGWGITNGTVPAHILAETIEGSPGLWGGIFDSTRESPATQTSPLAQAGRMLRENIDTAKNLAARLLPSDRDDPAAFVPGEGRVIEIAGDKIAVARDDEGHLHAVDAMYTHLGCELAWNNAMQTCTAYLAKPIDIADVRQMVAGLLQESKDAAKARIGEATVADPVGLVDVNLQWIAKLEASPVMEDAEIKALAQLRTISEALRQTLADQRR